MIYYAITTENGGPLPPYIHQEGLESLVTVDPHDYRALRTTAERLQDGGYKDIPAVLGVSKVTTCPMMYVRKRGV